MKYKPDSSRAKKLGRVLKIKMAGRRKKTAERPSNAMASYKPPLVFTESPLQGRKFWQCTPVQAARRPFLAPSVPVDQDMCKWVSPQFESTASISPYLKPSRRQKGRQRSHRGNEIQANKQVLTKSSLQALAFLDGNQDTNTREEKENTAGSHSHNETKRRSRRIEEKEKRAYFLFEKTVSQTPTKIREMEVLAYETPEHLMPQSRRTGPFQLWTK